MNKMNFWQITCVKLKIIILTTINSVVTIIMILSPYIIYSSATTLPSMDWKTEAIFFIPTFYV